MKVNRLFLILLLCSAFLFDSFAEIVSKIEYIGCQRIEPESVETYLPIQVGDDCDGDSINEALKALNKTDFFEEVKIEIKGSVLKVYVKEFPIINKISFEGNSKFSDRDIKKFVKLKERTPLSPTKMREIQQGLLHVYRKMGRFNTTVVPKIIKLSENRVNVVFEINEGVPAGIGRIVFVGNENVSSSDLRDIIYSKVKRWYRFFVTDDIYDPDRLSEDRYAITKYYHENGYANAKVISAIAELSTDKSEFVLTFTIDEGEFYTFDEISVKSYVPKLSDKNLEKDLYCRKGERYNQTLLNIDSADIAKKVGKDGFSAVKIVPKIKKDFAKKSASVVFEIRECERIYISKIVINGNTKTRDHVIRREILLEEGDAYNHALITMAESNLRELGFFSKVDIKTIPDPNSADKCILQISVEEAPTAEAMASGSYSTTDGMGIELTYNEKNFFGKGTSISVFLGSGKAKRGRSREIGPDGKGRYVSKKSKFKFLNNVRVSFSDPHIFDKDIEGTISGYRYVSSRFDGFDVFNLGTGVGISYDLSPKISQTWKYSISKRKFNDVSDDASPIIRYQTMAKDVNSPGGISDSKEASCNLSSLKHTIGYNTSFLRGIKGNLSLSLSTTMAGLGGQARHLKNELFGSYKLSISRKTSLTFSLSTGVLSKMGGKDPHIVDSFQLGLDSFRGFDYAGFGPFSSTIREKGGKSVTRRDFIGGKKYWKGSVEYAFPIGLPEELMFRGFLFSDFGTLWDAPNKGGKYMQKTGGTIMDSEGNIVDGYNCDFDTKIKGHKILDGKKIRASVGFGVSFVTPFGPLKLTYALPVKKQKYDEQYRFLIGFSTTF
ncbi:MAG: outer membrane protein assembly factor BamA [Holosporales bacterium]|jgi:outer membrane protein insertion porin family|nr:outer membrane protein assembly factor BamA [Holosporales bacterium]